MSLRLRIFDTRQQKERWRRLGARVVIDTTDAAEDRRAKARVAQMVGTAAPFGGERWWRVRYHNGTEEEVPDSSILGPAR